MKPKTTLYRIALIYGIVFTLFVLSTFGLALIGEFVDKGIVALKEMINAMIDWYDDPTAFFIWYIIGYALIWWKAVWGSIIIMAASILVSVVNFNNLGFLIFAIPAFLVGVLYILAWDNRRKQNLELRRSSYSD